MAEIIPSLSLVAPKVIVTDREETVKVTSSATRERSGNSPLAKTTNYNINPEKGLPDPYFTHSPTYSPSHGVPIKGSALSDFIRGTDSSEYISPISGSISQISGTYQGIDGRQDLTIEANRFIRNGGNFNNIVSQANEISEAKASGSLSDEEIATKALGLLSSIANMKTTPQLKERVSQFANNLINNFSASGRKSSLSLGTNGAMSSETKTSASTRDASNKALSKLGSQSDKKSGGNDQKSLSAAARGAVMSLADQQKLAAWAPFAVPGEYYPPLLVTDTLDGNAEDFSEEGMARRDGFIFLNIGDFKLEDATFPRNVPILKVPDADIDAVQDLGFGSGTIKVSGRLWAQDGMMRLESLRNLCKSRRPLIFLSQETGAWKVFPLNVPGVTTSAGQPYQYSFDLTLACVGQINEKPSMKIYETMRKFVELKLSKEKSILDAWQQLSEVKNFEDLGIKGDPDNPRSVPGYYFDATVIANERGYGFSYDPLAAKIGQGIALDSGVVKGGGDPTSSDSGSGDIPGTADDVDPQVGLLGAAGNTINMVKDAAQNSISNYLSQSSARVSPEGGGSSIIDIIKEVTKEYADS